MEIPAVKKSYKVPSSNGRWRFPEIMDKDKYTGFVYIIRDNYLERFYLGKKSYAYKSGKNSGKESEWRKYNSSSSLLKEIFAERGFDEFDFICLEQYKTRGTLAYSETWTLCLVEAPTNVTWYNTRIEKVSWAVKEPITNRHKERLKRVISMEVFNE